jgi:alkylation response protein AidB-like acyl-CoA dehydrogenase
MAAAIAHLDVGDALGLAELADWRRDVRSWLQAHVPRDWRARMAGAATDDYVEFQHWWLRELRSAGLAAGHWPVQWGGGGFDLRRQVVLAEEMARADAPRLVVQLVALGHGAATLLGEANDEQRRRHLARILEGEIWCQGFSEPNAGSDLAGIQTRADRRDGVYVLNGQKVWSSFATHADYCLLLAKTNREAPRRKNLSMFILDMSLPGVEVRPIRQSTGAEEFCEIFLTDVELPAQARIGDEDDGWSIAQRTLSAERGPAVLELAERLRSSFERLRSEAAARIAELDGTSAGGALRQQLAAVHAEVEIVRLLCHRMLANILHHGGAGPEASIIKIFYSEAVRRLADLGTTLEGLAAHEDRPFVLGAERETGHWLLDYISSWGWTIGGGTNEVLRNVVAERVLGLPR